MPRRFKKDRKEKKRFTTRRRACRFCVDKLMPIDYKLAKQLSSFISEAGKVVPRRITGNCAFHQRALQTSIKRARILALLPYCMGHTATR